jgi:Peptidase family M13
MYVKLKIFEAIEIKKLFFLSVIPAGILQGKFFSADQPRFINFASIGYVIGELKMFCK